MELVRLNEDNQEGKLIEGYDSLIWSERFGPVGDFQITTGKIEKFLQLLPEQTYVCLRDSPVPMIVETHQIKTPKNGPEQLVIKGRSFESILDRRIFTVLNEEGLLAVTPSGLVNGLLEVVCNIGLYNVKDQFPTSKVKFALPADEPIGGDLRPFEVTNGNLLTICQNLLAMAYEADPTADPPRLEQVPHAFRTWRPTDISETACFIQTYAGVDRTNTVIFAADRRHLNDGQYLFSKVGSANVAYGRGGNESFLQMFEGATEPEGLERRVILMDATDSSVTEDESIRLHMSMSLSEAKETAIFDGTVNPDISEYKYREDYNLGDLVTIQGRFGLTETARVTEYIRTQDNTGEKAYPTLTTTTIPTGDGGGGGEGGGGGGGDP